MPKSSFVVSNIFRDKLWSKEFTRTVEISPPKGFVTSGLLRKLEVLQGKIDAVSITDCALSQVAMNSWAFGFQVQQKLGLPVISHLTCRDRNSLAIQSDLLGAHSLGIENFLIMRGDPVQTGNEKGTQGVFHHDTPSLLRLVNRMNRGKTEGGNLIKTPPDLFCGAVANPSLPNQKAEAKKVSAKIAAGAQYILTQPVFDHRLMRSFILYLTEYDCFGKVPIIMGVLPIRDLKQAQFLNQKVPGLFVPAEVLIKFQKKDRAQTGIDICQKSVKDLRNLIQGIHLFSMNRFDLIDSFIAV